MTNWQMKDTLLSVCSHTDISLNAAQKHTRRLPAELGEGRGGQGAQGRAARCGGGPPRHVPRCSVRRTDVLKWVQSHSEGLAYSFLPDNDQTCSYLLIFFPSPPREPSSTAGRGALCYGVSSSGFQDGAGHRARHCLSQVKGLAYSSPQKERLFRCFITTALSNSSCQIESLSPWCHYKILS